MDATSAQPDLEEFLTALPTLTTVLDDPHTGMALVGDDGQWHLEQNSTVRRQASPLAEDRAADLIASVRRHGPTLCRNHWWVRSLHGGDQRRIVFERRPAAEPDGLSTHTIELLQSRLTPGTNGLIFGTSQSARSGLLLSLTRFLPTELLIYVGPIPPMKPQNASILHVPPPRHDRDRRELTMLFERASAILFDGPIDESDVRTLLSGDHVKNRWLAINNPIFDLSDELDARLSTRIGVSGSPAQSIRLNHISVRQHDQWQTLLDTNDLQDSSSKSEEITVADKSPRLSAQLTSPIDHLGRSSAGEANDDRNDDNAAPPISAESKPNDQFDVKDLLVEDPPQDSIRESGEINIPGFVSRSSPSLAKDDDLSDEEMDDIPTNMIRGERIDNELPGLVATSNIDEVEIPAIQPEQLRQTHEGLVDIDALKEYRRTGVSENTRAATEKEDAEPDNVDDNRAAKDSSSTPAPSSTPKRGRQLHRSTGLGAESSTASLTNTDRSGQWQRAPASSGRVIPVPRTSPENDRSEAMTAELGCVDKDSALASESDEGKIPRPIDDDVETDDYEAPGKKIDDMTEEVSLDDVLSGLRSKRISKKHDS